MKRFSISGRRFSTLILITWSLVGASLSSPSAASEDLRPASSARKVDFHSMANRVDALVAERWKVESITPAPLADDAEFLRRAYLDLTGVIPPVAEVRAFLSDDAPQKREQLIERLLTSPAHATHLATIWRNIMLPAGLESGDLNSILGVQNWLRSRFAENMRYDRIVSELLVATGGRESGPALFYTSLELKPEELAANTARIFLGLQIQCAQCHDHPYDHWSQSDFWGYAAFFAQLQQSERSPAATMNVTLVDRNQGDVTLPDTDEVVPPKYPEGLLADSNEGGYRRQQLSIWMASRDNPFLARALTNRVWSNLFGRGLVEPVDDLSPRNPPSHPKLLEELTDYFIETGFDMRMLYRMLANTRAYQLSSQVEGKPAPPELFAQMMVKSLSAEQLYDSLSQAAIRNIVSAGMGGSTSNRLFDPQRRDFLARMETSNRSASEFDAGLPQALMLMNGDLMVEATQQGKSRMLTALEAPWFSNGLRIETLFLATYSRFPTNHEKEHLVQYVENGDGVNQTQRLGDVFWALLNSAEFALNH